MRELLLRILITGAAGFAGSHLATYLHSNFPDAVLHGAVLADAARAARLPGVTLHTLDLRDGHEVDRLIAELRPDHIYHLAAQAYVPRSFEAPWETLENNILSQLNLFQACLKAKCEPRILILSSAEVYGPVQPDEIPIHEDAPLRPTSPYAVSKIAQDMLGLQYHLSHQLPVLRARPFNHIGPGQNEQFVAPAFAMQIARIEAGLQAPVIKAGDLTARRDFTDVRDVVQAYHLIMTRGAPGTLYHIASGQAHSVQELVERLLARATRPIDVMVDPSRLRPGNVPILVGDYTRLHEATGWRPSISFEQSLADILDDCRQRIQNLRSS